MRTAVALLLLALLPATAGAGGVPILPAGAAMEVERAAHTATRLADGRVLVTGGFRSGEAALASSELYDPQTRTFSSTGQMTSVRSGHTATLLRNGRVLIAGGFDDEEPVRTAELYDPATGSFEQTGSLTAPRGGPIATLLRDGRVLVAGGYDGDRSLASADLYDPATGRFARTGSMRAPRAAHTANGRFSRTGPSSQARFKLPDSVAVTPSGAVLVAGGAQGVERFRNGRFAVVARLDAARYNTTATLLKDGSLLVVGGYDRAIRPTAQSFLYRP